MSSALAPRVPTPPDPTPPERACPDCGHPAPLNYCPRCGQRQGPLHVSILELFHEWVEEFFHFDSKLLHTLGPLVFRPGLLTLEYVRGRRTRYLRPFRLWFAVTITYFVLMAVVPTGAATGNVQVGHREPHASPAFGIQVDDDPAPPNEQRSAWEQRFEQHVKRFTAKDRETIGRQIQTTSAQDGPHLVLLLVPVFALLLKLFYWRAPMGEHFVFAFHLEAFYALLAMAALLVACVPGVPAHHPLLELGPFLALAVYLPLALRRVHAQGWRRTLSKSFALWIAYVCCWGALQAAIVVITILRT